MQPFGHNRRGPKSGGAVLPFYGGAGSHLTHVAWAEAYHCTQWHHDPSSRFATTDMGRKLGGAVPLLGGGGELGLHLTQCGLGRGLPLYQVES